MGIEVPSLLLHTLVAVPISIGLHCYANTSNANADAAWVPSSTNFSDLELVNCESLSLAGFNHVLDLTESLGDSLANSCFGYSRTRDYSLPFQ